MKEHMLSLGHVGLRVTDLSKSVSFYQKALNLSLLSFSPGEYAHLGYGKSVHLFSLTEMTSVSQASILGNESTLPGTGHVALEAPNIAVFYHHFVHLKDECQGILAAFDHATSWALYIKDPDKNKIEVFLDRREQKTDLKCWQGFTRHLSFDQVAHEYLGKHSAAS